MHLFISFVYIETNFSNLRHEMAKFILYICTFVYRYYAQDTTKFSNLYMSFTLLYNLFILHFRYMEDCESYPVLREHPFYTQQLSPSSTLIDQLSKAISFIGHLHQHYDPSIPHQTVFRLGSSRPITNHLFHLHLDVHCCYLETLYRLKSKQCNCNIMQ